ncbi:hypothetical protein GCM10027053_42570 [Intrasporangium mesophilum]
MGARVLVLPSPLLGPAAYGPFVEALARAGVSAELASASITTAAGAVGQGPGTAQADGGRPKPETAAHRLVAAWAEHAKSLDATALVAHSNAGYLAPLVRERLVGDLPLIFMDAALLPTSKPTALAPQQFRSFLETIADETGLLPRWTRWWPPDELAGLAPAALLEAVDRDCPQLPLTYFDAVIRPPTGWVAARNGYVAFGDTYAEETTFAEAAGWPVVRLKGEHLHHAVAAHDVARVVLDEITAL